MSDPVPVFGEQLAPHERRAKAKAITFRGYIPRRRGSRQACRDLGGLFIDRLYSSGQDLRDDPVSAGARMLEQAGDD